MPLPVGYFRFLTVEEISQFRLDEVEPDSDVGYIIECDLKYPAHLHDLHNDYPMAPEQLTVSHAGSILLQYCFSAIFNAFAYCMHACMNDTACHVTTMFIVNIKN